MEIAQIATIAGKEFRDRIRNRWVLAVAGTHGKTTTSSLLAHILEFAGLSPGFLIGGVPGNFDVSARLGASPFFVIEADEYDTAFFDKRAKFVHYRPRTLVLNNLEFDHADIYPDLESIKRQFSHLLRIVPGNGLVVHNAADANLDDVLARRTRISIEAWDRGVSAAPVAAKLMAGVLGWDADREALEVERYLQRVAAERASQEQPDDESADRVRLEAPDIVQVD